MEVEGLLGDSGTVDATAARRLPVTLAVTGDWPAAASAETSTPVLVAALRRLRRSAEEHGLTPVGFHLDLTPPRGDEALERYAETLAGVRRALDGDLFVSVSLDPPALRTEGVAEVAEAVDFLVPFLYGPRPDGGPAPHGDDAWKLTALEPALARLAELGRPFLLGIGTVGQMVYLDAEGRPKAETTTGSLGELVRRPGLSQGRAALLDALDRLSYGFQADRPLTVGPWRLARGEQVQVLRLAPYQIRHAAARAEEVAPRLHLGQLYVRLPRPGEGLTVTPLELAAVPGEGPVLPALTVDLEAVDDGRSRFRVRFANRGPVGTDVAFYENNFVELHALGGGVFTGAEPGGFQRYQLEHDGRRVTDMRALRHADRLKLFLPYAAAGETVVSGPVELRGAPRSGPVVEATARFAVPGGELVELPAAPWPRPEPEPQRPRRRTARPADEAPPGDRASAADARHAAGPRRRRWCASPPPWRRRSPRRPKGAPRPPVRARRRRAPLARRRRSPPTPSARRWDRATWRWSTMPPRRAAASTSCDQVSDLDGELASAGAAGGRPVGSRPGGARPLPPRRRRGRRPAPRARPPSRRGGERGRAPVRPHLRARRPAAKLARPPHAVERLAAAVCSRRETWPDSRTTSPAPTASSPRWWIAPRRR